MSNRVFYSVMGIIAIVVGGLIYLLFRENTYFTVLADEILPLELIRERLKGFSFDFVQFHLSDFLWSFSLCCGFLAIFNPDFKGSFACAAIALFYGIVWELMQYCDVVSGIGDIYDMITYFAAGVVVLFISFKRSRKNEKNN